MYKPGPLKINQGAATSKVESAETARRGGAGAQSASLCSAHITAWPADNQRRHRVVEITVRVSGERRRRRCSTGISLVRR